MFTKNEQPWVEYLEIDEKTLKRTLKSDAPEEIKRLYEKYLEDRNNEIKKDTPIAK